MVASGYIIEQAIFLAASLAFVVVFALALVVEKKVEKDIKQERRDAASRRNVVDDEDEAPIIRPNIGRKHFVLTRLGLLTSVLQVFRFVDPFGVNDVYPRWLGSFFSHNVTALLFSSACFAFYQPMQVVYRITFTDMPAQVRYGFSALAGLTLLTANVTVILMIPFGDVNWVIGIFVFEVAVALLVLLSLFNNGVRILNLHVARFRFKDHEETQANLLRKSLSRRSMDGGKGNATDRSERNGQAGLKRTPSQRRRGWARGRQPSKRTTMHSSLSALSQFQFIANLACMFTVMYNIWFTVTAFSDPERSVARPNPDEYTLGETGALFYVFQTAALGICYWYAYVPIRYLCCPEREQPDSDWDSDSD